MKKTTVVLAAILLTLASCKKAETATKTKTQLLTSGTWKWSAYTHNPAMDYNGDGTPDADWLSFFGVCFSDNTFTFKTDGTVTIDEGATKCNTSDPQTQTSNWSFSNSESKIFFVDVDATINTLDETTFKVSYPDTLSGKATVTTLTFKH